MPYQELIAGQPIEALSASTWKAHNRAARYVDGVTRDPASGKPSQLRSALVARVVNKTAQTLTRSQVVELDGGGVTLEAAASSQSTAQPAYAAVTPTDGGRIGVLATNLQPAAMGGAGRVAFQGLAICKVDIQNTEDITAGLVAGDYDKLRSGLAGCEIVDTATDGTGEQWCLVRLGGAAPAGDNNSPQIIGKLAATLLETDNAGALTTEPSDFVFLGGGVSEGPTAAANVYNLAGEAGSRVTLTPLLAVPWAAEASYDEGDFVTATSPTVGQNRLYAVPADLVSAQQFDAAEEARYLDLGPAPTVTWLIAGVYGGGEGEPHFIAKVDEVFSGDDETVSLTDKHEDFDFINAQLGVLPDEVGNPHGLSGDSGDRVLCVPTPYRPWQPATAYKTGDLTIVVDGGTAEVTGYRSKSDRTSRQQFDTQEELAWEDVGERSDLPWVVAGVFRQAAEADASGGVAWIPSGELPPAQAVALSDLTQQDQDAMQPLLGGFSEQDDEILFPGVLPCVEARPHWLTLQDATFNDPVTITTFGGQVISDATVVFLPDNSRQMILLNTVEVGAAGSTQFVQYKNVFLPSVGGPKFGIVDVVNCSGGAP